MLVSFRLVTEPGCGRGAGLLIRLAENGEEMPERNMARSKLGRDRGEEAELAMDLDSIRWQS